jgi:uncharacterized protein (DUF2267 family)
MQLDRDRFIELVAQWADVGFDSAERAARATLEALGERIDRGEAQQVAEQLPPEVAPWVATTGPAQGFDVDEFLRRVADREGVGIQEAERQARAVFQVLRHVLEKEFDDVVAELPKDFAPLLGLPPVPEVTSAGVFLKRVSEHTGLAPDEAERATDAVLETLAERIAGGEVKDLIARLPARLHEPLKRGDEPTDGKAIRMSVEEFLLRVSDREGVSYDDARDHTRAVLTTLHEALGDEEWSDVTVELPREYDAVLA